jgi:hypothetical protein
MFNAVEKSEKKIVKTPDQLNTKSPTRKVSSYKNIFDDKVVEGKRQRKPKVIDDDLPAVLCTPLCERYIF